MCRCGEQGSCYSPLDGGRPWGTAAPHLHCTPYLTVPLSCSHASFLLSALHTLFLFLSWRSLTYGWAHDSGTAQPKNVRGETA